MPRRVHYHEPRRLDMHGNHPKQSTSRPASNLRRFGLRFLISLGIGVGLCYLAFRDLRPADLWQAFMEADYRWVAPYVVTLLLAQILRSWRWRHLLEPLMASPPGLWRLLTISAVGFAAIVLLPLRLGELVRPYLIADPRRADPTGGDPPCADPTGGDPPCADPTRADPTRADPPCADPTRADPRRGDPPCSDPLRADPCQGYSAKGLSGLDGGRLRMSAALGTIAVERVVDGLLISLFLCGSFLYLHDRPGAPSWMLPTGFSALAIFVGATAFLAVGLWRPAWAISVALNLTLIAPLARRMGGRMEALRIRLEDLLEGIISGFAALAMAGVLARFIGISLLYWGLNGLGYFVLARAFHLDMSLVAAFALCGMIAIGILLPSGPGLVGNFHEFGRFGLQVFLPATVIAGPGMAYIVLTHGLHLVWHLATGLAALASKHVRFTRLRSRASLPPRELPIGRGGRPL